MGTIRSFNIFSTSKKAGKVEQGKIHSSNLGDTTWLKTKICAARESPESCPIHSPQKQAE